ncbi:MAG: glycosyltransferase, partial [Deltaproteobacteria bacterium]|nr:glycosyltransferase [Deltaproteobacteria bacterium]
RLTQKLARFMRSGRYDVVHVNNSFGYQPASILAGRIARVPVIAHVRNPTMFTAVTKALARQVAQFVVVNQSLVDTYAGRPVSYIREAIEAESPPRDVLVKMRSGSGAARLILASAGRLDEQKGFEYLIRAAQIVCSARPDVLFLIAGEGPLREPLQTLINSAGLAFQVRLLGFRSDPQMVIAASDIFVCSSLWEGSPLAVLEAMALGVPTISTNVGVVPEVIVHGESGWLTQPRNPESLARAMLDAADSSKEVRAKIIAAAKSAVAPFQDTAGLARQFEAALEKTN